MLSDVFYLFTPEIFFMMSVFYRIFRILLKALKQYSTKVLSGKHPYPYLPFLLLLLQPNQKMPQREMPKVFLLKHFFPASLSK
jgi:hypothetical protein